MNTQAEPLPIVSRNPDAQRRYEAMRGAGESHSMAEMLACRAFPGVRTDSTFNQGRVNGNQFEATPALGDYYQSVAHAHGQSTTGKFYCSQLAAFPGDPEAWVTGRGDVERVCAARGYSCEGDVNFKSHRRDESQAPDICPELLASEVDDIMDENPGLVRGDVEERVREVRTGKVDVSTPVEWAEPTLTTDEELDFY